MAIASSIHFTLLVLAIISLQHTLCLAITKSYIVYLGMHPHGPNPTELDAKIATQSHYDLLGSVLGSYNKAKESVLYSYNKYINGFAVKLTEDEVVRIKKSPKVVSVFENQRMELQTTRSWEFLGLEQNGVTPNGSLWNKTKYGDGIIIGNLDTGVWPESESFKDREHWPIPSKWKGACMTGLDTTFKCNNKLIGARYFYGGNNATQMLNKSSLSPRDDDHHGTHTLSTAGGNFVQGVSAYGFGYGVAKGGSPNARVAAYKVCWKDGGCRTADIMAAIETAIGDGVDVLSISINHVQEVDYKDDGSAIAYFHAVQHGITVVNSVGNNGPDPSSVASIAPWLLTVGATTIDRNLFNKVYLGNSSLHFKGAYLGPNKMQPKKHFYPLIVSTSAVANSSTIDNARICEESSLDSSKVKGKIVICEYSGVSALINGQVVQEAGGVGMIVINPEVAGASIIAEPHFLLASHLSYKDGQAILDYANKTKNPTAHITDVKTVLGVKPSPVMADFSGRGPSIFYPQILKPDVTAPGVNIIAAFDGVKGPSNYMDDTRRVKYYVMSGTSMSCPHVAGIVALLKSMHPDWSPAVIRSAIMTTATTFDNENKTIQDYDMQQAATPFAYGAGQIIPNNATNPGLIYNLTENDYLDFLCSVGSFSEKDIQALTKKSYKCANSKSILDFNYPSITVSNFTTLATLSRTLTNVGNPGIYEVKVIPPSGVTVKVIPSQLKFNHIGEEQIFSVELKANTERPKKSEYVFGSLMWSDGTHYVRSPLVVERV